MIRALVVDDEPVARGRIRRLLRLDADLEVIGEAGDGRSAIAAVLSLRPDVVFLDVQMPELDGFEVVRALGAGAPAIVFVTAFDQYAIRAFEVHAIDYLMKPFTPERLALTLARVKAGGARAGGTDPRLGALLQELRERPRYVQRLPARAGPRIVIVEASEIDWIGSADNYVLVHARGREFLMRETLTQLERELDPEQFVRIHRTALVRLDRIGDLVPSVHGDYRVTLKDGTQLTLSRHYRDRVERVLRREL